MSVLNSTILEKAWLEGSNDFQQRIPNPTQADYANVVSELFAPYNNDLFNQFSGLLNGLMGTYIESKTFYNPLRSLKKPAARFGNTERHVAVRYLKAHSYKADDETLLKLEKPEYREWFYSVTAPRRYEFSWSRYELARVFASDGYGFDDLLAATLSQMISSDEYDEMNLMIEAFAEAENRLGGLYKYHISAAPTTEATGKELLTAIRAIAGKMKFPSVLYNHIDVPVYENGDTLILWVTPETMANLDVQALASVFQLDKADIQYRIVTIPDFPVPNVYAALTSEDFIFCRDVQYGIEPPFYNPANMTYKYYLHHAQMIGVNPVANCVLFTTAEGTGVDTIDLTPDRAVVNPDLGMAVPGYYTPLPVVSVGKSGETAPFPFEFKPGAAKWSIVKIERPGEGDDDDPTPIPLNSQTFIDNDEWLHVQKSNVQAGDIITLEFEPIYTNPSGTTVPLTCYVQAEGTSPTQTNRIEIDIMTRDMLWSSQPDCLVETYPYIQYVSYYGENASTSSRYQFMNDATI